LILCPSLLIDDRNDNGITALMKAALQGRVRCTRLLLLAGASPVVRDFGRGMCAPEWASYCGRSKCVEIIEKYMDKMQLNPGLGCSTTLTLRSGHRFNSTQSLKRSSLPAALSNLTLSKGKESWVKNTLKKAMDMVSGGKSNSNGDFNVASQLTTAVLCVSTPALSNDLCVTKPPFTVPIIQISGDDSETANPSPNRKAQRSRRSTSPVMTREEVTRLFKQIKQSTLHES